LRDTGVQSQPIDDRPTSHDGRTAFASELQRVSRLCPAAPYRQIVENGQGGIGIAFQRPNPIPRLKPRIQTKVALQVSMPGFAVAGMQADPTPRLVAKQRRSPLARSGGSADRTRWSRARTGIARYTSPNPRRPKKATTISSALPDGANSSLIAPILPILPIEESITNLFSILPFVVP